MCYQYNEEVKMDTKKAEVESSADKLTALCRDLIDEYVEAKSAYAKRMAELYKQINHKEIKVVYISSPFSAKTDWEVQENVEQAMRVAIILMEYGYVPLYTHGNYYLNKIAQREGIDIPYDKWIENCVELLSRSDAMLYLGYSKGCNIELDHAIKNGISVFFSVDDLVKTNKDVCADCTITF